MPLFNPHIDPNENLPHRPFMAPVPIPSTPFDVGQRWALCINGEWLGRVLGALETLLNLNTWQGSRLQQHRAVEEARRMIASLYECEGETVSFDCCDPILEKLDQIIALISRPPAADPAVVEDKRDAVQDILDADPFDPLDLHPDAPTVSYTEGADGGGAEILADRQAALCHGLWLAAGGFQSLPAIMRKALGR